MAQPSPGYSRRGYNRAGMLAFLDEIAGLPAVSNAATFYLPAQLTTLELEKVLGKMPLAPEPRKEIARQIITSPNGSVIFSVPGHTTLVMPPFPVKEKQEFPSLETQPLHSMLSHDHFIGVVLVRLGAYAMGVFTGEKLLRSKVGTGNIHARHRQGGSSSHRFERHRDKQIETFMNRAGKHAREIIEPYVKNLDYIVYGGARDTIQLFRKYCPLLMKLDTPVLPPLLDIPDPRQPVLEDAIKRVWRTEVVDWGEGY